MGDAATIKCQRQTFSVTVACRCFPFGFADCEVHHCGRGDRKSECSAGAPALSQYFSTLTHFTFYCVTLQCCYFSKNEVEILLSYTVCH